MESPKPVEIARPKTEFARSAQPRQAIERHESLHQAVADMFRLPTQRDFGAGLVMGRSSAS
jgi:hypothetical protein